VRHKGEKQPAHPTSTAQQYPPTALQLCWQSHGVSLLHRAIMACCLPGQVLAFACICDSLHAGSLSCSVDCLSSTLLHARAFIRPHSRRRYTGGAAIWLGVYGWCCAAKPVTRVRQLVHLQNVQHTSSFRGCAGAVLPWYQRGQGCHCVMTAVGCGLCIRHSLWLHFTILTSYLRCSSSFVA
jgi:hypothetical protein